MNSRFFNAGAWDLQNVNPPWGDRPSIYRFLQEKMRSIEPGRGEERDQLPDDDVISRGSELRWAPGALDGVFGHHLAANDGADAAKQIFESFRALTSRANDENATALYSLLTQHSTLQYVDDLLEAVVSEDNLDAARLQSIAFWLATNASDREPVKCAIALLGLFRDWSNRDLLMTLGRHNEFTLFAAVALGNSQEDAELLLWNLALDVTGWGRVHIIERLANTKEEPIKAWLLREGYQNEIMEEYTALTCAQTGDLLNALKIETPDEKLLKGAGSLLKTLIQGRNGPSAAIDSYPDGAEAAELYLGHLKTHELDLEDIVAVSVIESFLNEADGEARDATLGWPERIPTLLTMIDELKTQSDWEQKIREGLDSEEQDTFWYANEAARLLKIDAWPEYFKRLQRGEDLWYYAMQTSDPKRIDQVVRLAEERLPLEEIGSGPTESMGMGPEFRNHSALDFVVQELRRFPGKGWRLIRTGLQGHTIRNRSMALQVLAAWDRAAWPADAEELLQRAIEAEPSEELRLTMIKTLAGEANEVSPIEDRIGE